jgi:amidase
MPETPPNEWSAAEAARAITAGRLTAEALVRAAIDRIEARESVVHAWTALDTDRAIAAARRCDRGPRQGPLHGVPIGVKDVLATADFPTEMGSPIYAGYRPRADASCVALARAAGAIVLGKTVTCEFAGMAPGPTANPLDPTRTPGGSSSGSAAAVADGMVALAIGTQTGGSVLRPASFCGIVGFKPTFGTFNRKGLKFAAESLDTIGLLTRTLEDAALFADVLVGRRVRPLAAPAAPPRIGLCRTFLWHEKALPETRECLVEVAARAQAAGADVETFELPAEFSRLDTTREIINNVERARALAWEWAEHRDAMSPQMQRTVEAGLATSDEAYREELSFAKAQRLKLDALLAGFDCLIAPCVNGEAPLGRDTTGDPSLQALWTVLHVPTLSLPAHVGANGLPVGVQIIARRGADRALLACALWLQARAKVEVSSRARSPLES